MSKKGNKIFLSTLSILAMTGNKLLAAGYAAGYSDWSRTRSNIAGEKSRYRYRDVSSWSACNSSYASRTTTFYREGRYDPNNCQRIVSYSCTREWCDSNGDCNTCTSHARNGGCLAWSNYFCCTGYACYAYSPNYSYSCGNTATCYMQPASWGSWSAWQESAVSQTTSRQIDVEYSYPLTYTIYYNSNGGSGSMSSTSASYTGSTTVRTNTFTKTGYHFVGWAKSANGSVIIGNGGSATAANTGASPGGSVTLYAKWERNTYTVNFMNGSSTYKSYSVLYTDTTTAPTGSTKKGYTFQNWKRTK